MSRFKPTRKTKDWAVKWFGWLPLFLDWIDKQMQRGRILGLLITALIGYHDYYNSALKDRYEKHRDRLIGDSIKLSQKVDSCKREIINHKYGD